MYRDPRFDNQVTTMRKDAVLFEGENEATCWVKACACDTIMVTLHPAELKAEASCEVPFHHCAPIPSCETYTPTAEVCIQPLDTALVGTNVAVVLERKLGRCGATEICRWDFSDQPFDEDGIRQWADDALAGRNGLVRLRVIRYGGTPVYATVQVGKCGVTTLRNTRC